MRLFFRTLLITISVVIGFLSIQACKKNNNPSTPGPAATATPGPTATPVGRDITSSVTFSTGQYDYGYVHVHSPAIMTVSGAVTLNLSSYLTVDSGATIIGDGLGYPVSQGPGAPTGALTGAGAGHGGAGGADGATDPGGVSNDSATVPASMGSGGGFGSAGCGIGQSYGGGLFHVNVSNGSVTLNGLVSMNGLVGCSSGIYGPGGGAGGTIYVKAQSIYGGGTVQAKGGSGASGMYGGGGGGGGIILLSVHLGDNLTTTPSVSGGNPGLGSAAWGVAGQTGKYNVTSF